MFVSAAWRLRGQDTVCKPGRLLVTRSEEIPFGDCRKYKAGRAMAKVKLTPQFLQEIRELAVRWGKIAAERAAREAGPDQPMDFQDMEQFSAVVARGLIEGSITTLLEQQAQTLANELPCPDCGTRCPVQYQDRTLTIENGQPLPLHEPVCHCPQCRRDFFPPAATSAPGQS